MKLNLPYLYKSKAGNSRWLLVDPVWEGRASTASKIIEEPSLLPEEAYYKKGPRRYIFRFCPKAEGSDIVIKSFLLTKLRHRVRFKKYALAEVQNLFMARKRNLPVPSVLGYGTGYKGLSRSWVAVLMEYIPFPSMLDEFIRGMNEEETWQQLLRTIPAFQKLYLAGCNHVDFNPSAIMMSPQGVEFDRFIDFQYSAFSPKPSPGTLASQLGYFGWMVGTYRGWVSQEMLAKWYEEALKALEIPYTAEIKSIILESELARRSLAERLKGKG